MRRRALFGDYSVDFQYFTVTVEFPCSDEIGFNSPRLHHFDFEEVGVGRNKAPIAMLGKLRSELAF
jgi:hypothetical protein